jgi:Cys-rich repeat protein
MDAHRFDRIARTLGARPSRRTALRALAAVLGGLPGGLVAGEVAACPRQRRCGEDDCCRGGKVCRNDHCRSCETDEECQNTYGFDLPVCVSGACAQCADVSGGASGDEICRFIQGTGNFCIANKCVECRRDGDCPADSPLCLDGTCADCRADADCTPDRCPGSDCPFCVAKFCRQCRSAADCPEGQRVCAPNGFCVERCRNDSQCPERQVCDARGRACVDHCQSGRKDGDETDKDCGGDRCPKCRLGQGCREGRDCVTGLCFNPPNGVCACTVDAHCPFDRPFCDSPVCVQCRVPEDCPATRPVCTRDGDCIARCARSNQCPVGQVCRRDGRCGPCQEDGDCPRGHLCEGGRCVDCLGGQGTGANRLGATGGQCADRCANGVQDGNETDVDCGGGRCPRCEFGQRCIDDSDCRISHDGRGHCGAIGSERRCAECFRDEHCPGDGICSGHVCDD